MFQAKCIQKFKKNNKIYGYRLQDPQGNTKDVTPDQLKQAIKNQQIAIINLTLTSDNRLIDTTQVQQSKQPQAPQISEEQRIKNMIAKSKTLGFPVKEIPTACNHKCYLISKSETQHIIYIPDDVTHLNEDYYILTFTKHIKELQGTIKVIGGHNLKNSDTMFRKCEAQSLDLSSFNTSNITSMERMFWECKAQFIDLHSFNTSNVTSMRGMFDGCKAQSLDLSSFNTSNVTDMEYMFFRCKAQSIDLSSFDTRNVTNMREMFFRCQAQSLDLSSFDTRNITLMIDMFEECQAQIKATDQKILKAYKNR